jgi:hypothetical protein
MRLLLLLWIFNSLSTVLCIHNVDASLRVRLLNPQSGGRWGPRFLLHIDVELLEGPAADSLRQSPMTHVICISIGENSPSRCDSLQDHDTDQYNVAVDPLFDGVTELAAWIQSKHDPPNYAHAVGTPSFLYLWNDAMDAIDGLSRRLAFANGYRQSAIELHLALAHAQLASSWTIPNSKEPTLTILDRVTKTDFENISKDAFQLESGKDLTVESTEKILERVSLVTVSNDGYTELTLNCLASLRKNCGMSCVLQVLCIDDKCTERLRRSKEVRKCPETIHSVTSVDKKLQEFSSYSEGSFNAIVKYKFVAIYERLLKYEYVLFTDGDVVFLKPDFLTHAVAAANNQDLAIQCDLQVHVCSPLSYSLPFDLYPIYPPYYHTNYRAQLCQI